MDSREAKRHEVMHSLLNQTAGELSPCPAGFGEILAACRYVEAIELLASAGELQGKESRYWRTLKQASGLIGERDLAHRFRAKRRETGLTDLGPL